MLSDKEARYLIYYSMNLPEIYYDVRPLPFIKKSKALMAVWEDLMQACRGLNTKGAILESDKIKIRPAVAAAFLKYQAACNKNSGRWLYFPDLVYKATSTKFDHEGWELFVDAHKTNVVVIENMDAKRLKQIDDPTLQKIYDFFNVLFNKRYNKILITTPNTVDTFEQVVGPELTGLLTANLSLWRKM